MPSLKPKSLKLVPKLLWFLCILLVLWSVGLSWFYANLISEQTQVQLDTKTDAIVVLTGGKGRLAEGVSLLGAIEDEPGQLFISGVDKGVPIKELLRHLKLDEVDVNCCIALGYEATNTRENARETLEWMQQKGYESLRLVTGHYHMPRSLIEFRHVMPDYKIVPHPVVPPLFNRKDWHGRMHQVFVVFLEYNKYLLARIRLQLISWFPDLGLQ